jgi:hypothetical protein
MTLNERELKQRVEELERENKILREKLKRRPSPSAREKISQAISDRVVELNPEGGKYAKQAMKRNIMEDLKWELRVRYANQLSDEHVEPALEFIRNWTEEDGISNAAG